jgi:predicted enzyme related to lactoylglutathione lyase
MPRPIHFEIHAENPQRAMKFYTGLFGWEFKQFADQPYWLVMTGDKTTPGIDGGLLPRRGPGPVELAAVNAFVCTIDVADVDAYSKRVVEQGGTIALPKMPIPAVGWLAYGKDTEGNLFGMITMDAEAK